LTDFYDATIAGSFGELIQVVMAAEAVVLDCVDMDLPATVNCTVEEVIPPQWGESTLTYRKPLYTVG
jgi:hypothetical protein